MEDLPKYAIKTVYESSRHLEREAEKLGVSSRGILRDWFALSEKDEKTGLYVIPKVAVGDMAGNIVMPPIKNRELAEKLGLPEALVGPALFASHCLRKWILEEDTTGPLLIQQANDRLREEYSKFGLMQEIVKDPATRFTGYLAHAKFAPKDTVFTSVGDVIVWVNGERVVGIPEKEIDTAKAELVATLAEKVWKSPVGEVEEVINRFAEKVGLDKKTVEDLKEKIFGARKDLLAGCGGDVRQKVYKPVDNIVTPWQIRNLQNPEQGVGNPYHYGAVDGTKTPEEFIETKVIPTSDIDEVVMATDGLRPRGTGGVRSLEDLEPTNPEFGEQTAVYLRRKK